jgi:hypothetical protein
MQVLKNACTAAAASIMSGSAWALCHSDTRPAAVLRTSLSAISIYLHHAPSNAEFDSYPPVGDR